MTLLRKKHLIILLITAVVLLIPAIAMQYTEEVQWTLADFTLAGVLLLSTGFICERLLRAIKNPTLRVAIVIFLIVLLALIWIEIAVGIFNSPIAGS